MGDIAFDRDMFPILMQCPLSFRRISVFLPQNIRQTWRLELKIMKYFLSNLIYITFVRT